MPRQGPAESSDMRKKLLTLVGVISGTVVSAGTAWAAPDYFGALAVYEDGSKVSEASGGKARDITDGIALDITFRDVTADGWGTYAIALQDAWYCVRSGPRNQCQFWRRSNDETNNYGTADGWRDSTMKETYVGGYDWRSNPAVCHHEPWYDPDDCDPAGWQNPS